MNAAKALAVLLCLMACSPTATAFTPTPTTTPPRVVLTSTGLPGEILVSSDTPTLVTHRRAKSTTIATIVALATDTVGGVQSVHITATAYTTCASGRNSTTLTRDLSQSATGSTQNGSAQTQLAVTTHVNMPGLMLCPSGFSWTRVLIALTATATNYSQVTGQTPQVLIRHDADVADEEFLRIGELNIANDIEGHPPYTDAQRAAIYQRWGQTLMAGADIVLLGEVKYESQSKALAQAAGLPYEYTPGWDFFKQGDPTYANTAVLSRCPIVNSTYDLPGGSAISNLKGLSQNKIADVVINCPSPGASDVGLNIHVLANHWPGDPPTRLFVANAVVMIVNGFNPKQPVFVGGDFNALASDPDFGVLTTRLQDGLATVQNDPAAHVTPRAPNPIDHVLSTGGYVAYQYLDNCVGEGIATPGAPEPSPCDQVCPSDHPFLLVSYELGFEYSVQKRLDRGRMLMSTKGSGHDDRDECIHGVI